MFPTMEAVQASSPVSSALLWGQSKKERGCSSDPLGLDEGGPGGVKSLALQAPASYLPSIVVTNPSFNELTNELSNFSRPMDPPSDDLTSEVSTMSNLSRTELQVQLHQVHKLIRQRERDLDRVARLGSALIEQSVPSRDLPPRSRPRARTLTPAPSYSSYGLSASAKLHPPLHRKSSSWTICSSCDLHADDYFGSLPTQSLPTFVAIHLSNLSSELDWPDAREEGLVITPSSPLPVSNAAPHNPSYDTEVKRTQARATELQRRLDTLERENTQL